MRWNGHCIIGEDQQHSLDETDSNVLELRTPFGGRRFCLFALNPFHYEMFELFEKMYVL